MKDVEKLKAIEDSFVAREVEFQKCPLGASFREFRAGRENSKALSIGDRAVVEMTVRCKKLATAKEVGGVKYYSTKDDSPSNSFTFVVGDGTVPPALEEALVGMKRGAIRRVELPSVLVFEARNKGQLPQPTTEKGKRVFKNLFKTVAPIPNPALVLALAPALTATLTSTLTLMRLTGCHIDIRGTCRRHKVCMS